MTAKNTELLGMRNEVKQFKKDIRDVSYSIHRKNQEILAELKETKDKKFQVEEINEQMESEI